MGQQVFWEKSEHTKHTLCVEVPLHIMLNWTKQKQDKSLVSWSIHLVYSSWQPPSFPCIPTLVHVTPTSGATPGTPNAPFDLGLFTFSFALKNHSRACQDVEQIDPPPTHTHTKQPQPSSDNNEPQAQQHCEGSFPQLGALTPKQVTGISKCVHMHSMYKYTVCTYACIHTNALAWTSVYTCTVCTHAQYVHMHGYTLTNACTYTHMQIQCAQHTWRFTLNICMQ